ncbi:MAG: sulfurtransferase [Gammaproteobacteria bacterium]|nr:sulfurtransferase [Gammaproteobacteria bacterium]
MRTISPEELKEWLDGGNGPPRLIDIREPWEFAICKIAGSENIPIEELPARAGELDRDRDTVFICHHGMRSQEAASWLETRGFSRTLNLNGGVDAWAQSVDPDMQQY